MGEAVKIVDLARRMIRLAGLRPEQDVEIRFTGLRPGEKLVERLYEEGALVSPTGNPDISIVREPHQVGGDRFHALLEALLRTAETGDRYDIKVMLSDMIPSYAPEVHAAVARDEAP
jgi:O-antigen biosynthesis protein WbqV